MDKNLWGEVSQDLDGIGLKHLTLCFFLTHPFTSQGSITEQSLLDLCYTIRATIFLCNHFTVSLAIILYYF